MSPTTEKPHVNDISHKAYMDNTRNCLYTCNETDSRVA